MRLATGGAKSVGLAVHGRVAVLDQAIPACAYQSAIGSENRSANRYASLGKPDAGLFEGDRQHALRVQ
jgi:hypothetical protein